MGSQLNFLDELSENKPDNYKEEVFEPVRRKPGRIIAGCIAAILVIAAVILVPHLSDVTVPDMSKWQLEDMESWVSKHHKETVLKGEYSKEKVQDCFITQDIKPGTRIGKNKTIRVTYSLGADPEELIKLPDIMKMNITDIRKWISDNQLSGVTVKQEKSEVVSKNQVISYEMIDGSEDEFQRKSRMTVYVSSGNTDIEATFDMPDFSGKTKTEVHEWAKNQQTKVSFHKVFNEDVDYGKVFEQNITPKTKINRQDVIEVKISRGKIIYVPDFRKMNRSEAQELAVLLGLKISYQLIISDEKMDTVISQDIAAGTKADQKELVTLKIARGEGKLAVPDFIGLSPAEANNLAQLYSMKIFIKNISEAGENGVVVSQSAATGSEINNTQVVSLALQENNVTVPDFTGLSQNKASKLAKDLGIELIFNNVETMKVKNQMIVSQDTKVGKLIRKGDAILLNTAQNSGIRAADLSGMSKNDAEAWALRNGITLKVIDCYGSDYEEGELYDQDCLPDQWISSGKVLTVYHCIGLIYLDSFVGKSKAGIINWRNEVNAKGADITLLFLNDNNTSKSKGTITNQSVSEDSIAPHGTVSVWVSASNDGVLIKNFEGANIDDFKLWCDRNSVKYIVKDYYSDTVEKGLLFGQNYKDTYLKEDTYLRIYNSLGKLYIDDYYDKPRSEIVAWQKEANKCGANIKLNFMYVYSVLTKGNIEYQSVKDSEIALDSEIRVVVSRGSN